MAAAKVTSKEALHEAIRWDPIVFALHYDVAVGVFPRTYTTSSVGYQNLVSQLLARMIFYTAGMLTIRRPIYLNGVSLHQSVARICPCAETSKLIFKCHSYQKDVSPGFEKCGNLKSNSAPGISKRSRIFM